MFVDVYNYLVVTVSLYTREQLKAYKSLDGYNFFINGWVNSVAVLPIGKQKNYLFLAVVKHSQSVSVIPLKVWIVIKGDGEVMCAHCTCMARLGKLVHMWLQYCLLPKPIQLPNTSSVQLPYHVYGCHQLFKV